MSKYNWGRGWEGSTDCAIARRIVDLHSRMEESVERVCCGKPCPNSVGGGGWEGDTDYAIARRIKIC